jgi:hypothetical protein
MGVPSNWKSSRSLASGSLAMVSWYLIEWACFSLTSADESWLVKLTADRPYADPEKAARRLIEHAHAFEPIQEGRIYIEKINGP